MTNTENSLDTSGGSTTSDGLGTSGDSSTSGETTASLTSDQTNKYECYCRQYSNWKRDNPKKIVDWTPTLTCSSITDDYTTNSASSDYTNTLFSSYENEVKEHCTKKCVLPPNETPSQTSTTTGDYSLNDCLDILPYSVDSKFRKQLGTILRNEHNLLNKIAQRNVNIELAFEPTNGILLNLDNNLANNISLNKRKLINKARNINTKKRMLLYDEETDRLYRMIIYILKFLLLVISIVTIKLIYDY